MKNRIFIAFALVAMLLLLPKLASAQCTSANGPGGVPFNCAQGTTPQSNDLVSGGSIAGGNTVKWNWSQVFGAGLNATLGVTNLASITIKNPITGATTPILYATTYGVKADGVTSDDVALKAAFDACAAVGGHLYLPPGKILLNGTGAATISIQDCGIEGTGAGPPINGDANSIGSTIYLTSTSVAPFRIGNQWSMRNVNFYWPNQAATNGQMTITQSTTVVTVSSIQAGWTLAVGDYIIPTNGKLGAMKITSLGTGSGGNGTYNVAQSQTLGSQTAYAQRITVYPPLFTCGGTSGGTGCGAFKLNNVNVINAYDGLVVAATLSGAWFWSDSQLYALHDMFQVCELGDDVLIHDNIYDVGSWMALTGFSTASKVAASAAGQQNAVIHATASCGASVNGVFTGTIFGWRYGILLDATGSAAFMRVDINADGVGSVLDASSGGTYSGATTGNFRVIGDCSLINYNGEGNGNATCIALGANSGLLLSNSAMSSPGSFLTMTGGQLEMTGNLISAIGSVNDGNDYYIISSSGGAQLLIGDNSFAGQGSNAHAHGILQSAASAYTRISNNKFSNFQDAVNITVGGGFQQLSGNRSDGTNGTLSLLVSGGNPFSYFGNFWDKPPVATISSCGGSGSAVAGNIAGLITVGSTNPTTSCVFQPGVALAGTATYVGPCTFMLSTGIVLSAFLSHTGPTQFTINSASDMHNASIIFNCTSEQ